MNVVIGNDSCSAGLTCAFRFDGEANLVTRLSLESKIPEVGTRPPGECVGESRLEANNVGLECGVPHVAARRSATYRRVQNFPTNAQERPRGVPFAGLIRKSSANASTSCLREAYFLYSGLASRSNSSNALISQFSVEFFECAGLLATSDGFVNFMDGSLYSFVKLFFVFFLRNLGLLNFHVGNVAKDIQKRVSLFVGYRERYLHKNLPLLLLSSFSRKLQSSTRDETTKQRVKKRRSLLSPLFDYHRYRKLNFYVRDGNRCDLSN